MFSSFQNFFENLSHEKSPVIFFKDTTFLQLQQVIKYIYSGDVSIAESQLQAFWNLLQSLGIPIETSMANPLENPPQHSGTSSVIVGNDMFVIGNVTQSQSNLVGGGLIEPILSPITENSFQMPRPMNCSSLAGSSSLAHNLTQEEPDRRTVFNANGNSTSSQKTRGRISINPNKTSYNAASSSSLTINPRNSCDRQKVIQPNVRVSHVATPSTSLRVSSTSLLATENNPTRQDARSIIKPETEAPFISPYSTMAANASQKTPDNRIKIRRYTQNLPLESSSLSFYNQYTTPRSQAVIKPQSLKKLNKGKHSSSSKAQCPVCKKFYCNQFYVKKHAKTKHDFDME